MSEVNFLVIKFTDNDFTLDFELALKLLWTVYGPDVKEHLISLYEQGKLKETLAYLFYNMYATMSVVHGIRIKNWEDFSRASTKDYISSFDLEFFKDKSDFFEWKNGEWVFFNLNSGEASAF